MIWVLLRKWLIMCFVMYAGRVMEYCDVHSLFKDPLHPYTQGLISALPNINDQKDRLYVIKGNVPSLYDMPAGCGFWPRCPYATERCKTEVPDLYQIGDRKVRCFYMKIESRWYRWQEFIRSTKI